MGQYKRWYDHDPILMEVMDLLQYYQDDLIEQAEIFISRIEAQVGKETIDSYYESVKSLIKGNRWYDANPVLSRTIELLRIIPPEVQRKAAQTFIDNLKAQGITPEMMSEKTE
ncbi:MAG: hypothetical protein PHC34_01250 [Candidatus Gastranaerophilales bacterium]|nr:hypothetical protein [Candidatus Gastranaerophilales bacterium]